VWNIGGLQVLDLQGENFCVFRIFWGVEHGFFEKSPAGGLLGGSQVVVFSIIIIIIYL
jgi:hypothetical protein